jgi:hypothetical protein
VTVQLGFEPKSLANGSFPDRDGLALRCLQAVLEYRESLLKLQDRRIWRRPLRCLANALITRRKFGTISHARNVPDRRSRAP